jgi:hypothetical protein
MYNLKGLEENDQIIERLKILPPLKYFKEKDAFNNILFQVFVQVLAIRLRQADETLVAVMEENASLKAELAGLPMDRGRCEKTVHM